jgi:hypothetical protein
MHFVGLSVVIWVWIFISIPRHLQEFALSQLNTGTSLPKLKPQRFNTIPSKIHETVRSVSIVTTNRSRLEFRQWQETLFDAGSGDHRAWYRGLFPGVKWGKRGADHSTPPSDEAKNVYRGNSTHTYICKYLPSSSASRCCLRSGLFYDLPATLSKILPTKNTARIYIMLVCVNDTL